MFTFKVDNRLMSLMHPNGIYASSGDGNPQFRLASAMEMKKKGVRYVGGTTDGVDVIECVRTGIKIPALESDGILVIETSGFASDIEECDEFRQLVKDIQNGLTSPIVEITPFLKGVYKDEGETNRHLSIFENQHKAYFKNSVAVCLLNEAKLNGEERSRLYCRRFGYCDTNIFRTMLAKKSMVISRIYLP